MGGYNVLIPDSSRDLHPETMLPIMDGLQQLEDVPVVMSMDRIRDMYKHTRYVSHGSYEIFQFYVNDLFRKHNIDFGVSVGLSAILEDGSIQELHHLMEECQIPNLLFLNARDPRVIERLDSVQASQWKFTYMVCSSRRMVELLEQRGYGTVLHAPLGTSPRIFHPAGSVPDNAPFPLRSDDERLTQNYDVSFVGCHSVNRERILSAVRAAGIQLAVFGDPSWQDSQLSDCYRGPCHYLQESNTVYNHSRITLDIPMHKSQFRDYLSNRVSDGLASGCITLTQHNPDILSLLGSSVEALMYDDPSELPEMIQRVLDDPLPYATASQLAGELIRDEYRWERCLQRVLPSLEMCLIRQG
ncbi:glycosyltransferase [bacterium]|nr:glycosyltransferase [bacterium]